MTTPITPIQHQTGSPSHATTRKLNRCTDWKVRNKTVPIFRQHNYLENPQNLQKIYKTQLISEFSKVKNQSYFHILAI